MVSLHFLGYLSHVISVVFNLISVTSVCVKVSVMDVDCFSLPSWWIVF